MELVTNENFDDVIDGELVLVDFWADWCMPCRTMNPILEEFDKASDVRVGKLNVEVNPEVSHKYNITAIPTMVFFREGEEVMRVMGTKTLEELTDLSSRLTSGD